jgi:hypothetical protein
MKNNYGQSMVEALFVVVFTTIVMFAFLQICIMVVDDMTANEAAFVAMRSAAVTERSERQSEAEGRVKSYYNYYYYFFSNMPNSAAIALGRSFNFSDKSTIKRFYARNTNNTQEQSSDGNEDSGAGDNAEAEGQGVTIWPQSNSNVKYTRDFSGNALYKNTVKIYYFTRVMFGWLVAAETSERTWADRFIAGIGSRRRYQSARSRMMPSPDENFYYKAYPGARKFDE